MSIISNIFFLIYLLLRISDKTNSEKIIFIGEKEKYQSMIQSLSKLFGGKIPEIHIYNKDHYQSSSDFQTLILDRNYILDYKNKLFLKKYLRSNNKVYFLDEWFQIAFEIIPPDFIEGKFYNNNSYFILKRFFDVIISLLILILSLPLIILCSLLIYIEDKGEIIYKQQRNGINGSKFYIYKLRTMHIYSESNGPMWAKRNDPRVTKIGKILRVCRVDELPQLFNVIKGDMSLIGPRPERPEFDIKLIQKIPNYEFRQNVLPGISGWAQVNYCYGASIQDTFNKVCFDNYYVRNYSLVLDLLIFVKTIKIIVNAIGSKPKN